MIVFNNISLKRGQTELLENATATINPKQKVGLVGKNGCGKSSLFALLKKELTPEGGEVTYPSNWRVSWVNQETPALDIPAIDYVIQGDREYCRLQQELNEANERNDGHAIARIHGQLETLDAWTIQSRAASLLHGLGFNQEEIAQPVKSFSGGWRMRLNLAQALLCPSDLLLLDEPTNHLDLDAVIWLERWLVQYQGTLVLISHDRDFLDPIVTKILHIENQKLNEYTGDYSSFEVQRATKLAQQTAMYRQQQQKISHLQKYIDRFKAKATKAKQAQSRMKALERMELIAPAYVDNPFTFEFRPPLSLPNPLVMIEQASAGYGSGESAVEILSKIKLNLVPGSRIGLLGKNGAGKSTLIRHLTGVYRQDAGEIFIDGAPVYENKQVKAQMAYIPDEPFYFLQADTLEMMRYFRGMYESFDEKMFYRLQEFFPGIDMKRNIRRLSKGMQKQVAFWLALCCRPKLLILDEPLDGLDPVMRKQIWTILMSEVAERRTTVLVSSHNLRELEDVCDHVGIMNHGKVIIERSLFDLHGNISKIQVACQTGMPKLPKEFEVLHMSNSGRVYTMIVKGNPREVAAAIQTEGDHLAIVDILPLTLEEIFIYEMGGLGYEVKDILF